MSVFQKGDVVQVCGRLKKVVEFLADADKETIRLLASFFAGEAKGSVDAKRLKKPCHVTGIYDKGMSIEVEMSKNFLWEEKAEYFQKVENPEEYYRTIETADRPIPVEPKIQIVTEGEL